jgi:hypothetical protein
MNSESKKINEYSKKLFIFFVSCFLILVIITIILLFIPSKNSSPNILTCGDGTFYGNCSILKPFFCEEGQLIEKSSNCGCYDNYFETDESCFNEIYTNEKENSFQYFFNGEYAEINLFLYRGIYDYLNNLPRSIYYSGDEAPNRRDFVLLKLKDEIQKQEIQGLIVQIQNLAPESKLDQARIAISLVQNIPYANSGENISFAGNSIEKSRFPYQVLYDNNGTCEEKSELLVLILKELGYGVAVFYYDNENHESVGIKCPVGKSLDESGYCFIETTAPSVIGDSGGEYFGTGKLLSKPEMFLINDGLSLPKGISEYRDSKLIMRLREGKIALILFPHHFLEKINAKYGILF